MNEQERAEWLARAVDNLIQRREAAELPEDLNDRDLQGLMRAAKARLDLADSTAHAGLQYEGAVWQKVLDRLEIHAAQTSRVPGASTFFLRRNRDQANDGEESERELSELEDVAALRRDLAAEMAAFAETHREAVWAKIQSRLAARNTKKGFLSFLTRNRREAEHLAPALDSIIVGQTVWRSADSRIDDLVELARKRRALGRMAQETSAGSEQRVWTRLTGTLHEARTGSSSSRGSSSSPAWQRLAAGVAALALLVAAVGPLPAMGLADHPVVQFIETVGEHVGVAESGPPPVDSGAPNVVEGTPTTAAEASQLLGLALSEPKALPSGVSLTSSLYYPTGLTSEGGVFLSSYSFGSGALLVFQEAASAADLGIAAGAAEDITLPDGTPATYFAGGWMPGTSGFSWAPGSAQTLIYDIDGVRTIIQYVGDHTGTADLVAIAAALK